ncbi:MAG: hypothetical protein HYZ48_01490 [Chlamydiales bacterium]|nr:hypothetical protein [Chlamydiales bacterium]
MPDRRRRRSRCPHWAENRSGRSKELFFCSGRVYYDLFDEREKRGRKDIALLRIEQLYPLHKEKIKSIFLKYQGFTAVKWVQEEPQNMGAWSYIYPELKNLLPENLPVLYVGREKSSSTSAGSKTLHEHELDQFLKEAFR